MKLWRKQRKAIVFAPNPGPVTHVTVYTQAHESTRQHTPQGYSRGIRLLSRLDRRSTSSPTLSASQVKFSSVVINKVSKNAFDFHELISCSNSHRGAPGGASLAPPGAASSVRSSERWTDHLPGSEVMSVRVGSVKK